MANDVVVGVNHGVHVELEKNKIESDSHHDGGNQIGQKALFWGHEAEEGAGGSSALGPSSLQRSSAAISSMISSATL